MLKFTLTKRVLAVLISVVMSATFFVGCNSDSESSSDESETTTTTTTTSAESVVTTTSATTTSATTTSETTPTTVTEVATTSATTTATTSATTVATTSATTVATTSATTTVTTTAQEPAVVKSSLSNPNATKEAVELYEYIMSIDGKGVLAGQQESTWMGSDEYEMNIIQSASGKLPAVRGLDYMNDDFNGVNRRAKAWWEKGGIVTICWHCGSDFSGSWSESMETKITDWDKALTEGTDEYKTLIAGMDKGAKALLELQNAGVPVLWRPFHEFDGAWFWWGKGGKDNFIKLWQLMYDRYTNHWGLNNLIWVLGYSGSVKDGWYPGDEYVDIAGADSYDNGTNSNAYKRLDRFMTESIPLCFHENGKLPDPDKLIADGIAWVWFMTWHTSHISDTATNSADYINKVYNHDYVITLDELPTFR